MPKTSTEKPFTVFGRPASRFDKALADRLEAQADDLRDRARYETGRERQHTLDDVARLEGYLCQMHC